MVSPTYTAAHLKHDNTQVVDYLVSLASVLSAKGVLDQKDADNLRLAISNHQSSRSQQPILLELMEQEAEFLDLLDIRYGTTAQAMNLLRHASKPHLAKLLQEVATWGEKTLERAKLTFNRPIYVFHDGECQRQQLLSTHLIAFANQLAEAAETLQHIQKRWDAIYPHDMAGNSEDDQETCKACADALGFAEVATHQPPLYPEAGDKEVLANVIAKMATSAIDLIARLNQNTGTATRYPVIVAGDRLKLACDGLKGQALPQTGSRITFEVRRLAFVETLAEIVSQVSDLASMTLTAIASDLPKTESRLQEVTPEAAKRRIAYVLTTEHVSARVALKAAEALFNYMRGQQIGPEKIIVSELAKIHPRLTEKSLQALQTMAKDGSLMQQAGQEKEHNFNRVSMLTKTFQKARETATTLALLIMCAPFIGSCGLKGPPVSDKLEPRPELPFRQEATTTPQTTAPSKPESSIQVKEQEYQ